MAMARVCNRLSEEILVSQRYDWGKSDIASFCRFDTFEKTLSYFINQMLEAEKQTPDIQMICLLACKLGVSQFFYCLWCRFLLWLSAASVTAGFLIGKGL